MGFQQNTVFTPSQPQQSLAPVTPVRPAVRPAVRVQPQPPQQPAATPVRTNLFPSFELPDFFSVPFAAFRSLTPTSGLPAGRLQGQPGATNLNILSGSYSYSVGLGR